mmetsp:Transcript_21045/g.43311  ORF Transcript_21045/g.43311 Transcript_21045/m.43311 type:complete len:99 (-) Transcript_21045:1612-1908(-)
MQSLIRTFLSSKPGSIARRPSYNEESEYDSSYARCSCTKSNLVQFFFLHAYLQENCDKEAEARENGTTAKDIPPCNRSGFGSAVHVDSDAVRPERFSP